MSKAIRVFGYTDIHWSDRDEQAMAVAMAAQRRFRPDITVIGGDLLNCDSFKRHARRKIDEDHEYDYINSELKPARRFLDAVQKHTTQRLIMLEGNHDAWFERWIVNTDGAHGLRSLLPRRFLSCNAKGDKRKCWTYVSFGPEKPERECAYRLRHDLIVTHGWCAPKYAARHHLDRARDISVIFHHTHRFDRCVVPLFRGGIIEAFSAGCLCKRKPMYAHNGAPTDWVHGFWVAFLGKQSYTAYPVTIKKGSAVLPDGTEVKT